MGMASLFHPSSQAAFSDKMRAPPQWKRHAKPVPDLIGRAANWCFLPPGQNLNCVQIDWCLMLVRGWLMSTSALLSALLYGLGALTFWAVTTVCSRRHRWRTCEVEQKRKSVPTLIFFLPNKYTYYKYIHKCIFSLVTQVQHWYINCRFSIIVVFP